jgi:hypothetical protein
MIQEGGPRQRLTQLPSRGANHSTTVFCRRREGLSASARNPALRRPRYGRRTGQDDHARPDTNAVVEVFHIFVGEANAARGHEMADGRRLIGAVDTIDRVPEVESARPERVAFAAGRKTRQVRLALDHLFRRMPVRPLAHPAYALNARPGEAFPTDADAVAHRFALAEHQIEKRVRGVDDDGASGLGGDVVDNLAAELGWQLGRLIGFRLVFRRQSSDPASGGATRRRVVAPGRRRVITFRRRTIIVCVSRSAVITARWRRRVVGRWRTIVVDVIVARIVVGLCYSLPQRSYNGRCDQSATKTNPHGKFPDPPRQFLHLQGRFGVNKATQQWWESSLIRFAFLRKAPPAMTYARRRGPV